MNIAWSAYRLAAPVLGALAPAARVFTSPREQALWRERMGDVSMPGGVHAWVHGASLGEANAVLPLVRELAALQPGARFCLTATTRTGRERLASSGVPSSLAPIDAPQAVRRFFRGVQPQRLFIVETELWPHWLMRARAEAVPVAIVSARLSDRSVLGYRRLGSGLRDLVAGLDGVLCQSGEDARRWSLLGARAERTEVVGNLKNDALPQPAESRGAARHALGLDPSRPLLVLGSIRPGELRIVARAWQSLPDALRNEWQVAILPRHARAAGDLREEAARAHQLLVPNGDAVATGAWRWEDRMGVLNAYYQAADVALVGGSLLPYGGHNPLEPAACGAAVIVGPHHESQLDGVRALERNGAVWIAGGETPLDAGLATLLGERAERERRAAAVQRALAELRGSTRRAVARLAGWGLWPVA